MSFHSFVGLETEYGIVVPDDPTISPVVSSARVVNAARDISAQWTGFDYSDEEPLQDARQPRTQRQAARSVLDDFGIPNLVLTNGARVYVDHAHPEYSTPECASPLELLAHEHAGDAIMRQAAAAAGSTQGAPTILLHKNNTDGKGAAYGTHENYLIPRAVPFGALTKALLAFFVSRCVYVGAGRTGSEHVPGTSFQISQRAEFFECEVGLETTVRRGIMNTRDEPHADASRFRRLHVINGDANMCEVAGYLKVGTAMLVLDAYAAGYLRTPPVLADAVESFHRQSHDLALTYAHPLDDGRTATALALQRWYHDECAAYVASHCEPNSEPVRVIELWSKVLDNAEHAPDRLVGSVDWVTKQHLISAFIERHGIAATDPRVLLIDLQYHDLRDEQGLYYRMRQRGRIERVLTDEMITAAQTAPPTSTRAYFRGESIRQYARSVVAAGWDGVVFGTEQHGNVRVELPDPRFGTEAHTQSLFRADHDVDTFLQELLASPKRTAESLG